jgi:hypothetical protein
MFIPSTYNLQHVEARTRVLWCGAKSRGESEVWTLCAKGTRECVEVTMRFNSR